MKENKFQTLESNISTNENLREPQRDGFKSIENYFQGDNPPREVGIVLPVGCGKSGLIALSPFASKAVRALVIAPGLHIKNQLAADFDPSNSNMFYLKCGVLTGKSFPEPAVIEGSKTNRSDLDEADVVITNIHQIRGEDNRWLRDLPGDFFDLILVDEAHHNVADSWEQIRQQFPAAKIVNFSATPTRADGRIMEGPIIYSFPIFRAIQLGYVKRLKAKVLNPATLRYVRQSEGREIEVTLDEIKALGEEDSEFRRGIVSSEETLSTIVDCSIRELNELRKNTGDNRHKIIASALNYSHCIQIAEAFQERGLRADYIHSQEDSSTNKRILEKLENHELDVIVQVRMLGEGFDHPYLSVAAVCSIFSNLTPFAQFIGRIMRVVDQNQPESPNNQGIVVFHAGANIAQRWSDFRAFSEADQEYFDQLLPLEGIDFTDREEISLDPSRRSSPAIEVMTQESVTIEEVQLLEGDEEAKKAIETLKARGFEVRLTPIPVTRQRRRQASRREMDNLVKTKVGEILNRRGINSAGSDLDLKRLGKTNWIVVKAAIDKKCNSRVGRGSGERSEFTQDQMDEIVSNLDSIAREAEEEIFNGKA